MSFSDKPGVSLMQKAGCALYAMFGAFVSLYAMVTAALGDCVLESDCISETTRAILFYGVPLALLLGGALLTRHFMRDKK